MRTTDRARGGRSVARGETLRRRPESIDKGSLGRNGEAACEPTDTSARQSTQRHSRRGLLGLGLAALLPGRSELIVDPLGGGLPGGSGPRAEGGVNHAAGKESARSLWGEGDYRELGRRLEPAALDLVAACWVSPGQSVLDVGAGNGDVALAAAGRGAQVVASDLSPALVEAGRARLKEEGADVGWLEADAEELLLEGSSFDRVLSCFGAMFAPMPRRAAGELFRLARPGGIVGMANWASSGFMGKVLDLAAKRQPLPAEEPRPSRWGRYETIFLRLDHLAEGLEVADRSLRLEFESIEEMWSAISAPPGPVGEALEILPGDEREAMKEDFLQLAAEWGVPLDGTRAAVDVGYVLVVARKPSLPDGGTHPSGARHRA